MSRDNSNFFHKKNIWSKVKDSLLGCYLKPYFFKILHTHKPLIYVDCFSGKGKFDDGENGSPLIALEIIENCLNNSSITNPQIQSFFIELNHAKDLQKNFSNYHKAQVQVIEGKYEDNIQKILWGKEKENVFLYLDPYGIKALKYEFFEIFSKMNFNSIEMLINMNSFGFIREACRALGVIYSDVESFEEIIEYEPSIMDQSTKSIENLSNIAGGDYWINIVENYKTNSINGYEAEIQFSNEYCKRLQENFRYVLNMPIRIREQQRPKYRMIHVTNHEDGCILMYENICKRWEVLSNIQTDGQKKIFLESVENVTIDVENIKKKLKLHFFHYKTDTNLNIILADFFTINGISCSLKVIRKIISDLEKAEESIIITRIPALTKKGKPSTFLTQYKNKSIFIRSMQ